jgi:hypothetical protein
MNRMHANTWCFGLSFIKPVRFSSFVMQPLTLCVCVCVCVCLP